jgi:pyruvate/2-oxoglutarate dehydrogenase complex dihydrolipoamide dehydrogenase (E3) component
VNIHLGTEATKEIMNAADAVIVAVGAQDLKLPIPGADGANVVSSWDVLAGKVSVSGNCAVIGGGLVGTETAEYLLEQGCGVTIIEMLDKIATGESSTMTDEEHKAVIDFCVKQVAKRVPVIAGTGSNDTAHAVELSKKAAQTGVDGLLVVSPYYNKATDTGPAGPIGTTAWTNGA